MIQQQHQLRQIRSEDAATESCGPRSQMLLTSRAFRAEWLNVQQPPSACLRRRAASLFQLSASCLQRPAGFRGSLRGTGWEGKKGMGWEEVGKGDRSPLLFYSLTTGSEHLLRTVWWWSKAASRSDIGRSRRLWRGRCRSAVGRRMTAAAVRCRPRRWSGLRAASEAGGLRRAPAGSGTADGEGRRSAAVDVASGRPDSRPRSHPPQPQPARRHRSLRRPAAGNLHHSVNDGG